MNQQNSPSPLVRKLAEKLGIETARLATPVERIRHIGAFWQHWTLHRRRCDRTGESLVSPYGDHCPYPVWRLQHWLDETERPTAEYRSDAPFFEQLWALFQQCPIPHNSGSMNENCEFTDDYFYSRNCYLSHNALNGEDHKYCYRTYRVKRSQFVAYSFDSELSAYLVNCHRCFEVVAAINSQNCSRSAFLYDCRNCSDCFFCYNLRNRQFCFENEQLTESEYRRRRAEIELSSRRVFDRAFDDFITAVIQRAIHRALHIDHCEAVRGDYLEHCKNVEDSYFIDHVQDCANCVRGQGIRDCMDCVAFDNNVELAFACALVHVNCFDVRWCYNIETCRNLDYCMSCRDCEHCFGCCGLVRKRFHILNRPFSETRYHALREQILSDIRRQGVYGAFFPGHFAPQAYDESWSGFHFPLTRNEQVELGFRTSPPESARDLSGFSAGTLIPDRGSDAPAGLERLSFWDPAAEKPFQIQRDDIAFANELRIPLTNRHYSAVLQDLFRWMPFNGALRRVICASCKRPTDTSLPPPFDPRIACESCYEHQIQS